MKTLNEIIDETRSGQRPDYDELRYAVCALESLGTFDRAALRRLAERGGAYAKMQYEESFNRVKRALAKSPKEWIGWGNDPDNPEFVERRASAIRLFEKVSEPKEDSE